MNAALTLAKPPVVAANLNRRPALRLVVDNGAVESATSWLHRDGLSSVRGVTGPDGLMDERATYRPFGEAVSLDADPTAKNESKGWIGERFDADAGLQYLNARYYDPKLGLFLQPDWWEVTEPGVGTNRYSYAFNDPIGASDPSGHCTTDDYCDGSWDEETNQPSDSRCLIPAFGGSDLG